MLIVKVGGGDIDLDAIAVDLASLARPFVLLHGANKLRITSYNVCYTKLLRVVRVTLHLEGPLGKLRQDPTDLGQGRPALARQRRAPGLEEDVLGELDDHATPRNNFV